MAVSKYIIIFLLILPVFIFVPVALAQDATGGVDPSAESGLVPCDGADCGFNDLIQLAQNLINWMVYISVPIAAIVFTWAGMLYVTAAGDPGKIAKAHGLFKNVALGFVIVLAAWLIVYTITNSLLNEDSQVQLLGQ